MKMNLKELREVFSQNKPRYKILFHFVHNYHDLGDTNLNCSPSFQQSGPFLWQTVPEIEGNSCYLWDLEGNSTS
jgi:hypothetical protein